MTINRYRMVLKLGLFGFVTIVFTGAAVRLTSSGLGCEDWPKCSADEFVPEWAFHSWIEFGNRLYSAFMGILAIAIVWATHKFTGTSKGLKTAAWLVLAGTITQGLVGAVVVKSSLNPYSVTIHFLLSMALLAVLIFMWVQIEPIDSAMAVPQDLSAIASGAAAWMLVVLLTGTFVTGTGPNGGDTRADRLAFDISWVARIHSVTVWLLLFAVLYLASRSLTAVGPDHIFSQRLRLVLTLLVAQGAIGYLQYELGVPPSLVMAHVVGAVAVFLALTWLAMSARKTQVVKSS